MSFSIKLRTDEFKKKRLVVGPIWVEADEEPFPDSGWDDFPVVILGWWLKAVKPLITNRANKCECLFMDGPYKFEVYAPEQARWTINFLKDTIEGEKLLLQKVINPKILVSELLAAASVVIDLCLRNGWESNDLSTLQNEAEDVQKKVCTPY